MPQYQSELRNRHRRQKHVSYQYSIWIFVDITFNFTDYSSGAEIYLWIVRRFISSAGWFVYSYDRSFRTSTTQVQYLRVGVNEKQPFESGKKL